MAYTGIRRAARSSLWTPRDLGTPLAAWFDSVDQSSFTTASSGTKISGWRDKSGHGNNVSQGTSGNQPLNNNPPAVQNNTGQLIGVSSNPSLPIGTSDRSIIFVSQTYSGRSTRQMVVFWGANSSGSGFGYSFNTTSGSTLNYSGYNGSTYYGPSTASYPVVINAKQMTSMIATGQNVVFNGNGTQVFSGAMTYNTTSGALYVFNLTTDSNAFQGLLYELIILSTASPNIVSKVEGYLAWKWSIQSSLSSSHQYNLAPPRVSA
jgi:hypothetical protein